MWFLVDMVGWEFVGDHQFFFFIEADEPKD
jgi:hypothetical protein